jgi:hypothetical protein
MGFSEILVAEERYISTHKIMNLEANGALGTNLSPRLPKWHLQATLSGICQRSDQRSDLDP